jgi:hypothetical protein
VVLLASNPWISWGPRVALLSTAHSWVGG